MRVPLGVRCAEAVGAGLALALAGFLFPADPGFAEIAFLPQALVAIALASLHGILPGFLAYLASAGGFSLMVGLGLLGGRAAPAAELLAALEAARIPAALSLGGILIAGSLRDEAERSMTKLFARMKELVRRQAQLRRTNHALSELVSEFEQRIAGQRDSVPALYARVRKLDSVDIDRVAGGLLDAVVGFAQATELALYEFDPEDNVLLLAAHIGEPPEESLSLEESLEGWVFRNNARFSLRSMDDYLGLPREGAGEAILAYPVRSGDLPWGVLCIKEMPFYRYNPSTENNIGIVIDLASSYIRKAMDFRDRLARQPANEVTGLPGFAESLRLLGQEIERREARGLSVSIVIAEVLGYDRFVRERGEREGLSLIGSLARLAASGGRPLAFHARGDGQLLFILPDIDRGGASLFCLELSEASAGLATESDGGWIGVELAFGLSAYPSPTTTGGLSPKALPEALVTEAERVLALSKGVFVSHGQGSAAPSPARREEVPN